MNSVRANTEDTPLSIEHNTEELGILAKILDSGVFRLVIDKVAPNSFSFSLNSYYQLFTKRPLPKWLTIPVNLLRVVSLSEIFEQQQNGVVQIEQFEQIIHDPELGIILNQQRDRLSNFPITLILSILDKGDNLIKVLKIIPDMWSIVGFILELERRTRGSDGEGTMYLPFLLSLSAKSLNGYRRRYRFLTTTKQEPFYASLIAFEIGSHYFTNSQLGHAAKWLTRAFDGFADLGEVSKSLEVCNTLIWTLTKKLDVEKTMKYRLQAIDMASAHPNDFTALSWLYKIMINWKVTSPESFTIYAANLQQNNLPTP
jgi:hypothetical protein